MMMIIIITITIISWIIKSLELIGINNKVTSFTKKVMS